MRRVVVALIASVLGNGCALFASATAHHNSRGTACVESPAFGFVDLVVGGIAAAGVAASDESDWYYVVPGVFLASGVIGTISAFRCQAKHERPAVGEAPPASNSAPSFGDAEVDPEARMATPEEMGVVPAPMPPTTTAPSPQRPPPHPVLDLRIDGELLGERPPDPPRPPTEERTACRDAPGSCPPSQTCAIAGADAGYCVPD